MIIPPMSVMMQTMEGHPGAEPPKKICLMIVKMIKIKDTKHIIAPKREDR